MKVEVAGVCGTDVSQYKLPLRGGPLIMGHENVGTLAKVGRLFAKHKGFKEGDLVFLEHYLPCGHCEWDHMGEYRHCAATEWFYDPNAIRYGYTSIDIPPGALGRLQPLRLPAAQRRAAPGARRAVARGGRDRDADVERHPVDADRRRRRLRIDGAHPGARAAGAVLRDGREAGGRRSHHRHRHVEGRAAARGGEGARRGRGHRRAEGRSRSSASWRSRGPRRRRRRRLHGGRGQRPPMLLGIEATKRRGGTMVVQGEGNATFPDFPIGRLTRKGHDAEERARPFVSRGGARRCRRWPRDGSRSNLMTTHRFGLAEVDYAIKSVGGEGAPGAIHVSVMPWK